MDLRIGSRSVKHTSDAAVYQFKHSQPLSHPHQFLINSFHPALGTQPSQQQLHSQARVNMEQQYPRLEDDKQHNNLRQLINKDKSRQSAVASQAVKQELKKVILQKQKDAQQRHNTSNVKIPTTPYRVLAPRPDTECPPLAVHSPPVQPAATNVADTEGGQFPLRKTVSEPNLKMRNKLNLERRKSPLVKKASAPSNLKRKTTNEGVDSSPSSSSTPVSGCSSPNDNIPLQNGVFSSIPGLSHETPLAQRLMMQEGTSLVQVAMANSPPLPTITLGLPAAPMSVGDAERRASRVTGLNGPVLASSHTPVIVSAGLDHDPTSPLSPRLIILDQTIPGLGQIPFHYAHPVVTVPGNHKPLIRTRSEPLPQNSKVLQHHLYSPQQQQHALFLERLKQQTQQEQIMKKSSEKRRLHQIPSEELDPDEHAAGEGVIEVRKQQSGTPPRCPESQRGVVSESEQDRAQQLYQQQQELILQQQAILWERHQRIQQMTWPSPVENMAVPLMSAGHRPLSRAQSSPAAATVSLPVQETSSKTLPLPVPEPPAKTRFTTGLVYDSLMLKHQCSCGDNSNHPEHAGRIQSIWSRLQERGLRNQCECIRGRKATLEELQSVHTERHVLLYGTNPLNRLKLDNRKLAGILSQRMFVMLACGGVGVDSDTIWNDLHSPNAARLAAGSVIELAFKVATRELKNGFAIVRPPGHHADPSTAMGFCFFNSVAITAKQLQQKLNVSKILIVDWDVHHGNGTQQVFYKDCNVLYISLHRYDDGNFFPGSGAPEEVGSGPGEGFNVNVAWTGGVDPPMGDPEYLAAFRSVVMPIAHAFSPDIVLVSAGFDAADGHPTPLGGYKVSAKCFGHMTHQLMNLAGGRVVLALEGGHDLTAICDASEACISALLGNELDQLPDEVLRQRPNIHAVRSLEAVIEVQSKYWKVVQRFAPTIGCSYLEAQAHDREEAETVTALASLSVGVTQAATQQKRSQEEPMEE
ncbi:histone deacetylase 7 isoform X2 [Protopterus annectens]|nr:histone deacetylase 7 isoform X2 [Protopterus annectens]